MASSALPKGRRRGKAHDTLAWRVEPTTACARRSERASCADAIEPGSPATSGDPEPKATPSSHRGPLRTPLERSRRAGRTPNDAGSAEERRRGTRWAGALHRRPPAAAPDVRARRGAPPRPPREAGVGEGGEKGGREGAVSAYGEREAGEGGPDGTGRAPPDRPRDNADDDDHHRSRLHLGGRRQRMPATETPTAGARRA